MNKKNQIRLGGENISFYFIPSFCNKILSRGAKTNMYGFPFCKRLESGI